MVMVRKFQTVGAIKLNEHCPTDCLTGSLTTFHLMNGVYVTFGRYKEQRKDTEEEATGQNDGKPEQPSCTDIGTPLVASEVLSAEE